MLHTSAVPEVEVQGPALLRRVLLTLLSFAGKQLDRSVDVLLPSSLHSVLGG